MKNKASAYPPHRRETFRMGEWIVHPSLNRLEGRGQTVQIEPKLMDVLLCLTERPGQVVSREDLLDRVWPEVVVGEEVLTRVVSELRRVLAEDKQNPAYIETIRKGGYRLIARVEPLGSSSPAISAKPGRRRRGRVRVSLWASLVIALISVVATAYWATRPGDGSAPAEPLRLVPLTSYVGTEQFPALSPDGSMVAFGWNGPGQDNMDIYVKQVGEETPLRLTDDPGWDTYPVWSPDGRSVTYFHGGENEARVCEVPMLGGEPRTLVRARNIIMGFTWLDEGSNLIYADAEEENGRTRLYRRNVKTEEDVVFLPHDENASDIVPLVSPDKRSIAFVRSRPSGDEQIYVMSLDGGRPRRLTEGLGTLEGLSWDAHSRSLVFSSAMSGNYSLWRVDVASGKIDWIPIHGEWIFHPSAASGAKRLVYQHRWFEKNIWRITLDEGTGAEAESAPLITSTRWDCEAGFSRDGGRLAFTSTRSGFLEVWGCLADGTRPVQLTRFGGPSVAAPSWSPDGSRIVFAANPDGFSDLYILRYEDRELQRVTSDEYHNIAPSWSQDGRWIYFGSDRSGSWELWKVPASGGGGECVRLTSNGGIRGHGSGDGGSLYFTKKHEAGLWRIDLRAETPGDSEERVLEDLPHLGDWNNWAIWDGGLVMLDYGGGEPVIVRYDFATAETSPVCSVPSIARPSLAVSPDGGTILYARVENSVSDIVMVEGFE